MIVSTRGRYALRVIIDLAENSGGGFIPMKTIAERQGISLKYLERILPTLTKNHLVEGVQGKNGGYRLCRKPEEYKIGEILRLTEGDFATVACLECVSYPCSSSAEFRTLPFWSNIHKLINYYFDGVTIADLMKKE